MASSLQHQAAFRLVLGKFTNTLTEKEKREFGATNLRDLHIAIETIQKKQASEAKLRGMRRLEGFLEGMKEYDKVIAVFLNSSEILAWVWGPMKFLLQVACNFAEAFDALLDAYQRIGEQIPLLTQYENYFHHYPQMSRVLSLYYEDILTFHWKAMKYFKQRMWKQLFHALWKSFNTEFGEILRNMREHRSLIESQASITQFTEILRVQEVTNAAFKAQKKEEASRRREFVQQWLCAANYEVDQETYTKVREGFVDTGIWLFRVDRFQSWYDKDFSSNQLLWLTGIPGAGKTILASLIVERARQLPGVAVAFFYCKYQDVDRNTFLAVARGILAQLLHQDDKILAYLYENASRSGQTTLSTVALAKELLETAVKNQKKLYVVIDGIDECDREHRKEIVNTFETFWDSLPQCDKDSLRCMFISQDDSAARKDFANMVCLRVRASDTSPDIRTYARTWSSKIKNKFDLTQERQMYIEDMITESAEGMFLYARLMSSYIHDQTSLGRLNEALSLEAFPKGPLRLDQLYARITNRLFEENEVSQSDTLNLFGWLVCAKRSLKWREIQCAVSINLGEQTLNWDKDCFRVDSKELCGSLIDIHSDGTVVLVHHTAKRFLIDKSFVNMASQELDLTSLCIGYLTFPCFDSNIKPDDIKINLSLGFYAFFDYAYAYWSSHLEKALLTLHAEEELCHIAEDVSIFVEMHWSEPTVKVVVPRSMLDRLRPLQRDENLNRIASAVYIARRQLNASRKTLPEERVLTLDNITGRMRVVLEEVASSTNYSEKYKVMYGDQIFKCPRVSCVHFSNGFSTKQQRDDHVSKHERSYFCSFSGCPMGTLGCATLLELQKHEMDYHEFINFDDEDDEFPEMAPEKSSFDCNICDAAFTRKHNLKNHMRLRHGGLDIESFVCTTCGKRFGRQGDRTRHMSTKHSDAKRFPCGGVLENGTSWGCGRVFNRADMLNRHWKSEKGRNCILSKQREEASQRSTSTPMQQPSTSHSIT